MNSARKGNEKELRSADLLEAEGWVVASRRHLAGPGDLLAVKWTGEKRLIEVKATADGPWRNFGPADREALRAFALKHGLTPEMAWWPARAKVHIIIGEADWPS